MRALRCLLLIASIACGWQPADARDVVDASAPNALAVTLYRDPDRGEDEALDRDWPQGFAMISETRTVTLVPGETTIRFSGVAEGMVAVSAIVTGLPGGTIEKNRNANLLSPAALVDGTLGNRVTITRTNPASGEAKSEGAVVRTRADGGLVLQTGAGFEAVRCAGIPEKLTFDRVPAGLSAEPVFSIDTRSDTGGTYTVTLTYLAWGFDWDASYVARLGEARGDGTLRVELSSWLTLVNDNGQSFENADVMAVAGKLNVTSDYEALADTPEGSPLRLTCYPIGSTASGNGDVWPPPPPPPPPMAVSAYDAEEIVVTGMALRAPQAMKASPAAMIAAEEALGDLKLYRVPERVTLAAKSQKQVAFLDRPEVSAHLIYTVNCDAGSPLEDPAVAGVLLASVNSRARGLGQSLPTGAITVYEQDEAGELLVAETRMRDYALDQDVELELAESTQVTGACGLLDEEEGERKNRQMRAVVSNAAPAPVLIRLDLGAGGWTRVRGLGKTRVKDGRLIHEFIVPANDRRTLAFKLSS